MLNFRKSVFFCNWIWTKRVFINICLIFKTGNSEYKDIIGNVWLFLDLSLLWLSVWSQVFPIHKRKPRYHTAKLTVQYRRKVNGPAAIQSQHLSGILQFPQSLLQIFHVWQPAKFSIYYNYNICIYFVEVMNTQTIRRSLIVKCRKVFLHFLVFYQGFQRFSAKLIYSLYNKT